LCICAYPLLRYKKGKSFLHLHFFGYATSLGRNQIALLAPSLCCCAEVDNGKNKEEQRFPLLSLHVFAAAAREDN